MGPELAMHRLSIMLAEWMLSVLSEFKDLPETVCNCLASAPIFHIAFETRCKLPEVKFPLQTIPYLSHPRPKASSRNTCPLYNYCPANIYLPLTDTSGIKQ